MRSIYSLLRVSLLFFLMSPVGCVVMTQTSAPSSGLNFYQQQEAVYQAWLDQAGLGHIIRVHTTALRQDSLDLYLSIYNPKPPEKGEDGAGYFFANFRHARQQFNARNSLSMEQQLFLKMLHIMEVDPQKASVQFYDSYDMSQPVLGFYGIYYEDQQIQVDSSGFKGTGHAVPVYIAVKDSAETGTLVRKEVPPSQVFTCIQSFFEQRLQARPTTNDCSDLPEKPRALQVDENKFQLSIKPLCKEVLSHQNKPAICDWLNRLGFNCTTIKKEWLTYTFTITPSPKGYQLDCYIDGKCKAPEVFSGTRYQIIDHDEASTAILQEYGDALMQELRSFLQACH